MAERRTGLVYDERCVAHDPPGGVPPGGLPDWATAPVRAARAADADAVRARGQRRARDGDRAGAALATEDELRLAHTEHVARMLAATASGERIEVGDDAWTGPGHARRDAARRPAALLAAVEVLDGRSTTRSRCCGRPATTPSATRRWASAWSTTSRSRRAGRSASAAGAGGDRRLGRAPRQRDRGDLPRRPVRADDLAAPGRALPGDTGGLETRGAGRERQRPAAGRGPATRATRTPSTAWSRRPCARSRPSCC